MPKQKTTKAKNSSKFQDRKEVESALWDYYQGETLLSLLEDKCPQHEWELRGQEVWGKCPFHSDSDASFRITPRTNVAHCHSSACRKTFRDFSEFYSGATDVSWSDGFKELIQESGISVPASILTVVESYTQNQRAKRALAQVMNTELRQAIANPNDPKYAYIQKTDVLTWLRDVRKLDLGLITHRTPIGILPPAERLQPALQAISEPLLLGDVQEILGTIHKNGKEDSSWVGCLVFFLYTSPNELFRFKVRKNKVASKREQRFQLFPSREKLLEIPNTKAVDGFFGLNLHGHFTPKGSPHTTVFVEGEFDVLSILLRQANESSPETTFIATGGSGVPEVIDIPHAEDSVYRILADNDKGGVGNTKTLLEWLSGKNVEVFDWDKVEDHDVEGMDPDSAVVKWGWDEAVKTFSENDFFVPAPQWVAKTYSDKWSKRKPNNRERNSIQEFLGTAFSDADVYDIIKSINQEVDLPLGFLSVTTADREAFEDSLAVEEFGEILKEFSIPIFKEGADNTHSVGYYFYNKKSKSIVKYVTHRSTPSIMSSLLEGVPNGKWLYYLKNHMVNAEKVFYETKMTKDGGEQKIVYNETKASANVINLLNSLCQQEMVPDNHSLTSLKDGIFCLSKPESKSSDTKLDIIVNNGKHIFRGLEDDKGVVRYEELSTPIVPEYNCVIGFRESSSTGNSSFRYSEEWSSSLTSVDDINNGMDIDLEEIFLDIRNAINKAWTFRYIDGLIDPVTKEEVSEEQQNEDFATYIACLIIGVQFSNVMDSTSATMIRGETHSGKTSLVNTIAKRSDMTIGSPGLVENALIVDSGTAAGVRGRFKGTSTLGVFDEFETRKDAGSGGNNTARRAEDVLDLFKNITMGSQTLRGTKDGEGYKSHSVKIPIVVAGIDPAEKAQDLNRFIVIETSRVDNKQPPAEILEECLAKTEEEKKNPNLIYKRLRKSITCAMLPRLAELRRAQLDMYEERVGKEARRFMNILSVMPVMKLVNQSTQDVISRFVQSQEIINESKSADSGTCEAWSRILEMGIDAKTIDPDKILISSGRTSLATILGSPEMVSALNSVSIGVSVFYIHSTSISESAKKEYQSIITKNGHIPIMAIEPMQFYIKNKNEFTQIYGSSKYLQEALENSSGTLNERDVKRMRVYEELQKIKRLKMSRLLNMRHIFVALSSYVDDVSLGYLPPKAEDATPPIKIGTSKDDSGNKKGEINKDDSGNKKGEINKDDSGNKKDESNQEKAEKGPMI